MNYKIISYPDGQLNAQVESFNGSPEVKIRINSYTDLFAAKSIIDAAGSDKHLSLFIPCLFGQRSDRRFSENESFGLKLIADFINSMGYSEVSIFDPHSDVSLALINNSKKVSSYEYVKQAAEILNSNTLVLVSPDAGAYKKVFEYAAHLDLPCVAANKHRDSSGEISLKILGDVKDKCCLIVDDLADGGRTFELLAEQLKQQEAKSVYLYVSHGYFSKGFDALRKNIDGIFCTNSVRDIKDNFVTQFKIV